MNMIDVDSLDDERVFSVEEVAEMFKVEPSVIYSLCKKQSIGHFKFPGGKGTIRIRKADIVEFQQTFYNPPRYDLDKKE